MTALLSPAGRFCGVDEAGRGPLAGPVVAAAVILDPNRPISGINDSKKLSARKRSALADEIRMHALAWSVAEASVEEIDRLNILHASLLAMRRAVERLSVTPEYALIDGNRCPDGLPCAAQAVVRGDAQSSRLLQPRFLPRQCAMRVCLNCTHAIRSTLSTVTWGTRLPYTLLRCANTAQAPSIAAVSGLWHNLPYGHETTDFSRQR